MTRMAEAASAELGAQAIVIARLLSGAAEATHVPTHNSVPAFLVRSPIGAVRSRADRRRAAAPRVPTGAGARPAASSITTATSTAPAPPTGQA